MTLRWSYSQVCNCDTFQLKYGKHVFISWWVKLVVETYQAGKSLFNIPLVVCFDLGKVERVDFQWSHQMYHFQLHIFQCNVNKMGPKPSVLKYDPSTNKQSKSLVVDEEEAMKWVLVWYATIQQCVETEIKAFIYWWKIVCDLIQIKVVYSVA